MKFNKTGKKIVAGFTLIGSLVIGAVSYHNNTVNKLEIAIDDEKRDYNKLVHEQNALAEERNKYAEILLELRDEGKLEKYGYFREEDKKEEAEPVDDTKGQNTNEELLDGKEENDLSQEFEGSEKEKLKEEQYAAREKKAYANLNSLGSSEAQETYKELIKPKLTRWADKDMLNVAKEGTNFHEIDDSHLPWTDVTEPNGTSTKHIYKNGYDQLEITYNFDGIITKSEWKTGVNK
ncbi:hypothetical protein [Bacillus mycoides]|uniref:hypothetical protein n=1 Tax=Bacillus mycoides TaxID=1405 RepID=UPI00355751B7